MVTPGRIFLLLFFVLLVSNVAQAQAIHRDTLDPYRRMNDPLAIADLGGADSAPVMRAFRWDDYYGPLDTDGYAILASDTGPGILRHFWATFSGGHAPDSARLRLWVDDSLLIDGPAEDFFRKAHGVIRNPFDTAIAGGYDCETQIPYKHSFRWTNAYCWLVRDAEWQRIDTAKVFVPGMGSNLFDSLQSEAEVNYWKSDPWRDSVSAIFGGTAASQDTMVVTMLTGPAYIDDLHFAFPTLDTAVLHNLWLECFWDRCPTPSIQLPLSDFFGIAMGVRSIRSFRLAVDSANSTLDCFFPMPFRSNAKIVLINKNPTSVSLQGSVRYQPTSWDRHFGYFATQYHVTPEIAVGLLHPVLHAKGAGRYIGAIFNYPDSKYSVPIFMEGDGYMTVDSVPISFLGPSIDYTGTEDYCNAGWYFSDSDGHPSSIFSLPFSGCPIRWPTMYRFHIDDPYIYTRSIDIDWGHGFRNDYTTTYRTTSFYYTDWTPFYPSSDTIVAGNTWAVTGAGYAPDLPIVALLDADTIYRGYAGADGSIAFRLAVPNSWAVGDHTFSINGIQHPERITVLAVPKLRYVQDTANRCFSEGDSIELRGYGFHSGERLTLLLGDSLFSNPSTIVADTDGVFRAKLFLPWVPEGHYRVQVKRESGGSIISDSSLFVTRTLNYEFELLPNPNGGATYSYVYQPGYWSQGAIAFCNGNWKRGSEFDFQFQVPFADTFSTTVFGVGDKRYGIYRTYIDESDLGLHDWFFATPNGGSIIRDSAVLPSIYLTAGLHTIRFVNEGWDDSAVEYSIAPDNMHLRPLSALAGYPASSVAPLPPEAHSFGVYPNPLKDEVLFVSGIPDSNGDISVVIYNAIGQIVDRVVAPAQSGDRSIVLPALPNGNYWLRIELPQSRKALSISILR